ncbi:hypothetical protein [Desulfovibrio sp. MES5]|uniref:hypothetical protein n=1 Tax=Desulfovibrio sp. MES5 TaxID=1899016 RepID=UPI0025B89836|nr:hypothetical protein [Desulfovibrio sp. MES5]
MAAGLKNWHCKFQASKILGLTRCPVQQRQTGKSKIAPGAADTRRDAVDPA